MNDIVTNLKKLHENTLDNLRNSKAGNTLRAYKSDFKDFGSEASSGTHWSDAFRMDIEGLKDASPEEIQLFKNLLRGMITGEESWINNLLLKV